MPLVKNTVTGNNYLQKINTDGDSCSRTAIRSYNKQSGSQGYNVSTRFYLPFNYSPSSHTLWVFVNGEKAVAELSATTDRQYEEYDNKTVVFGASLLSDDVIEFIVAGSYLNDEEVGGGGGGGLTWVLVHNSGDVLNDFGYMVDTQTNGPLIFTLPPAPIEGDTFAVVDAFGTFGTNAATLTGNGWNINGLPADFILNSDGMEVQFVFDGIDNWIMVNSTDHDTLVNWVADKHRLITVSDTGPTIAGDDGDIWIITF